ncbi:hypothetical protein [Burkholderia lata]|uniref:hypothetical protein n=2 Tax=Burkholderia TaxID=32008 RepID=UPI0015842C8C|nr:hypothetical protein [Burkholderia lata]
MSRTTSFSSSTNRKSDHNPSWMTNCWNSSWMSSDWSLSRTTSRWNSSWTTSGSN